MAQSMTKKTVASFLNVLLVASLSTTAFAAGKDVVTGEIKESKVTTVIAKAPVDLDFKALDTDADGKISLQEAVKDTALATNFNKTDINHDGSITADEYALYASTSQKPNGS